MLMQRLVRTIYPAQCVHCEVRLEEDFNLCSRCWSETPFIIGLACDLCGAPMIGSSDEGLVHCDDCMVIARPWAKGRAAMLYQDLARSMVLSLKHGDRTDVARAAGRWLARAGADILRPGAILTPVPIHWTRFVRRRFNQSALMVQALNEVTGHRAVVDGLVRTRRTPLLDGLSRDQRFATLSGAISVNPRRAPILAGAEVVLVDDVMTTGATLAAAAEALHRAGASRVSILVLARVAKDA